MSNIDRIEVYGLEVLITDHCNLRCFGCAQNSPYLTENYCDPDQTRESLIALEGVLRPQKLKFLGGEPLLHPYIDKLIGDAAKIIVESTIAVKTNGLLLPSMTDNFWAKINFLTVSV